MLGPGGDGRRGKDKRPSPSLPVPVGLRPGRQESGHPATTRAGQKGSLQPFGSRPEGQESHSWPGRRQNNQWPPGNSFRSPVLAAKWKGFPVLPSEPEPVTYSTAHTMGRQQTYSQLFKR